MENNFKKVKSIVHIVLLISESRTDASVRLLSITIGRQTNVDCNTKSAEVVETSLRTVPSCLLHPPPKGVGLIFWGIMSNYVCVYCNKFLAFSQFVDSTAAGFVIIMFILCVGICCSEELERQTQMAVSYMGGIFYLLSVVFLGMEYDRNTKGIRMICALIFSSVLAVLHFFEAIYITVKKEMKESV